ncbi:MAG: hypothetical protein ACI4XA_03350 [Oscillospiraceae bacterium]
MFDFAKWIVGNLISGVKNGVFSREWAAVQLGNYYVRGRVTDEDIARFDAETGAADDEMG